MPINYERLSKSISYALRHNPADYGLELDHEGWVAVEDLLAALRERRSVWRKLTQADIETLMANATKQRFELVDGRIRAFYGHSVPQVIEKTPTTPPEVLYHGTTPQVAAIILAEGLKPMQRQYVHLSTDQDTARLVGLRRAADPVILCVRAREAYAAGVHFYAGNEDIWLSDPVPSQFIERP